MKKGFTLVELLAVIAVVAVLSIIVVPNVMKLFTDSTTKSMDIQENSVLDAANIFVNDYCTHPIGKKKGQCGDFVKKTSDGKNRYICLSTLQNLGYDTKNDHLDDTTGGNSTYIDAVYYKTNVNCLGFVYYQSDSDYTAFKNGKTYLQCGSEYMTDGIKNIKDGSQQIIVLCGGNAV